MVAEIEDPAPVARAGVWWRVVAPRLTPRFVEARSALGCEVTSAEASVHEGRDRDLRQDARLRRGSKGWKGRAVAGVGRR